VAACSTCGPCPFDPGSDDDLQEDPPARLAGRAGEIGEISVAFMANGMVHFWEHYAAWYLEWQDLTDSEPQRGPGTDKPPRLSDEERARLASELADAMLTSMDFRAAKTRGARQRLARLAVPAGTDQGVGWDAESEACDRAEELARAQYAQIDGRLDDLAAELLTTREYQQVSSAGARKQVAELFLIRHADGFSPPSHVRDELHARAQQLARSPKSSTGLF
jgi:hypothetical protein